MEKSRPGVMVTVTAMAVLCLVGVASCICAEFKRTQERDLMLDGKLCYLPGSSASRLGTLTLICLSIAQIIGSVVACCFRQFCLGNKRCCSGNNTNRSKIPVTALLFLSWICFGITGILLGTATSMSREQPYGDGWLNGECYTVRKGVFMGSATLVIASVGAMFSAVVITLRSNDHLEESKSASQPQK